MKPQTSPTTTDQNQLIQRINATIVGLQTVPLAPHIDEWGDTDCDKTPQQRRDDYIKSLEGALQRVNRGFVPQKLLKWVANLESLVNAGGDA